MIKLICWAKKKWLLSFILVSIVIQLLLSAIGANEGVIAFICVLHLVAHIIFVVLGYKKECKLLEKERVQKLLNYEPKSKSK